MRSPNAPELQLLLACARARPSKEDEATIRRLLSEGVDWTKFARKAIDHGLAGLVGHTLARMVPEMVPADILGAFRALIEQTRQVNRILLEELSSFLENLAAVGVDAIPFKGPVLAMQAFGDLGLRGFRDLDFLIHDRDVSQTIKTLCDLGYERQANLTAIQLDVIHRLQGQEIMFKTGAGAVEPHTRLTPIKMALDIDYGGLWRRACRENILGHQMLTLEAEDTLILLAIHGGKELWWDIKWACDVADFIASHPTLDWDMIVQRARAQGCLRMLLVATSLAHNYLAARIPDSLARAEAGDPVVEQIIGRVLARWEKDDPGGPPSNKTLSADRLRLHDGVVRQMSYVVRTSLLPGPQHISLATLPKALAFAYIPIGLAHDLVALPFYRAYVNLLAQADRIRDLIAVSPIARALAPISSDSRKKWKRRQQARAKALAAVVANPKNGSTWSTLGDALVNLTCYKQAIANYDKALALTPDNDSHWEKRRAAVAILKKSGKFPEVGDIPDFVRQDANGWAVRAGSFASSKRYGDAVRACEEALRLDPSHLAANRIAIFSRCYSCNWRTRESDRQLAAEGARSGRPIVTAFVHRVISESEEDGHLIARIWARGYPPSDNPLWQGERYKHDKIRIAYISTDFRIHPVGIAMVGCLEHSDRARFETTAISLGHDDESDIRRRVEAAVDRFVDARAMDDASVAKLIRELEIDIAIDLNGLTGGKRPGILAPRPAPVQVNYLGYPGTMAAPFIDYIIADPVVIPAEHHIFYDEKVAYLPNAYLPHDRSRAIAETAPSREQERLPETGFVFACFNKLSKISPEIFDIWMRLLHAVEGSVLWLQDTDRAAKNNLRHEAEARGISANRLVFARTKKLLELHLARLSLADLFLDTLPYNAHATAVDALWAGLPVLTCLGKTFPGRVATGVLRAAGMPELVTTSLAEYEDLALALARDPRRLADLREKLARNRVSMPLFDTERFARDLESIYTTMWERQQAGLAPENFSVLSLSPE
jgi:predicted O-linked N-acetylglucosamine transferase (SPINDLY family)